LYEIADVKEGGAAQAGEKIVLGDALSDQVAAHARVSLLRMQDVSCEGLVCAHPFRGKGFDFDVPLLPGTHVTAEAGTGFVHTAPGHGDEDFELGRSHDLEVPRKIDEEGTFYPDVPLFAARPILTPDGK